MMPKLLGYFVHKDDKELNAQTVMVLIDEGHERLTCFSPYEAHCEADRGYLDECTSITKEQYLEASKGYYTPVEYIREQGFDLLIMQEWVDLALETKEDAKDLDDEDEDKFLQLTWMDAVPFDQFGNPTGEVNEYVINRGYTVIVDGIESEQEGYIILDELQAICEE